MAWPTFRLPRLSLRRWLPAPAPPHTIAIFGGAGVGKTTLLDELCAQLRQQAGPHGWLTPVVKATPHRSDDAAPADPAYPAATEVTRAWVIDTVAPNGAARVIVLDTPGELLQGGVIPDIDVPLKPSKKAAKGTKPSTLSLRQTLEQGIATAMVCFDPDRCDRPGPDAGGKLDDLERTRGHLLEAVAQPINHACQTLLLYLKADELGLPRSMCGRLLRSPDSRRAYRAFAAETNIEQRDDRWAELLDTVADDSPAGRTLRDLLNRTRGFYELALVPGSATNRLPPEPYLIAARPPRLAGIGADTSGGLSELMRDLYAHLSRTRRPKSWRLAAAAGLAALGIGVCASGWSADAQGREVQHFELMATARGERPLNDWRYDRDELRLNDLGDPSRGTDDLIARRLVLKRLANESRTTSQLLREFADRVAATPADLNKLNANLRNALQHRLAAIEATPDATPREVAALDRASGDPVCLDARARLLVAVRAIERAVASAEQLRPFAYAAHDLDAVAVPELAAAAKAWAGATAHVLATRHPVAVANLLRQSGPDLDAIAALARLPRDPYRLIADTKRTDAAVNQPVTVTWAELPKARVWLEVRDLNHPLTTFTIKFDGPSVEVTGTPSASPAVAATPTGFTLIPGRLVVVDVRIDNDLGGPAGSTKLGADVWLPAAATAIRSRIRGGPDREPLLGGAVPSDIGPGTLGDLDTVLKRLSPIDPFEEKK